MAIPETLTLDQAFRAAFFLADQYLALERVPDEGLLLFHQYLQSDPARWEDWKRQSVWRWRALEPILSPRVSTAVSDRTGRDPPGTAEYSVSEVQARWLRIASTRAVRTSTWAGGGSS